MHQFIVPSMSVTVRGVGSVNSDVAALESDLAGQITAYGNELNAALNSAPNDATLLQYQASLNALADRNAGLIGSRPSTAVLAQLQTLQTDLNGWYQHFHANVSDKLSVKTFVVGSIVIVAAGATAFWLINKSLKKRRRRKSR